jgi:hypothetical protein
MPRKYTRPSLDERLWSRVLKSEGCWTWTGKLHASGYGLIYDTDGRDLRAHRVAWELTTGEPIPDGWRVGHVCDNPPCVRNDDVGTYEVDGVIYERHGHLWLATHRANMLDMIAKGRSAAIGVAGEMNPSRRLPEQAIRGERHVWAKLTEDAVRTIRARYAAGGIFQRELADEYGVAQSEISRAINGRGWKHV